MLGLVAVPATDLVLTMVLVDQASATTGTALVDQAPELVTVKTAWAAATASDQAAQAVWGAGLAATGSAATALAVLGMELAVPSSRPSLSSPSREEASALGRLRTQETRVWPMQHSRLTLLRTSRSPQLLMDEAHHLSWPSLSRPRQCSECTLHWRPFSESDRHHPLPADIGIFSHSTHKSSMPFQPLAVSFRLLSLYNNTTLVRRMAWLFYSSNLMKRRPGGVRVMRRLLVCGHVFSLWGFSFVAQT